MSVVRRKWDRLILDASPPVKDLGSLTVGDLDRDGHEEIVTGGDGVLLWYRPDRHHQPRLAGQPLCSPLGADVMLRLMANRSEVRA
jgi:hypothetical protein